MSRPLPDEFPRREVGMGAAPWSFHTGMHSGRVALQLRTTIEWRPRGILLGWQGADIQRFRSPDLDVQLSNDGPNGTCMEVTCHVRGIGLASKFIRRAMRVTSFFDDPPGWMRWEDLHSMTEAELTWQAFQLIAEDLACKVV